MLNIYAQMSSAVRCDKGQHVSAALLLALYISPFFASVILRARLSSWHMPIINKSAP